MYNSQKVLNALQSYTTAWK